jgi:hypothetical protein
MMRFCKSVYALSWWGDASGRLDRVLESIDDVMPPWCKADKSAMQGDLPLQ